MMTSTQGHLVRCAFYVVSGIVCQAPVHAPADGSAPKLHVICFGVSTVLLKLAESWMEALLERGRA